jgi:hypothetical protein
MPGGLPSRFDRFAFGSLSTAPAAPSLSGLTARPAASLSTASLRSLSGSLAAAARPADYVGFLIVSVSDRLLERSEAMMKGGEYTEGYYLHGFGVRLAEAAAEWVHRRMRREWGIEEGRGLRYAWGYPACPDHMQHEIGLPAAAGEGEARDGADERGGAGAGAVDGGHRVSSSGGEVLQCGLTLRWLTLRPAAVAYGRFGRCAPSLLDARRLRRLRFSTGGAVGPSRFMCGGCPAGRNRPAVPPGNRLAPARPAWPRRTVGRTSRARRSSTTGTPGVPHSSPQAISTPCPLSRRSMMTSTTPRKHTSPASPPC